MNNRSVLNFPLYNFNFKIENGVESIFDEIRKKWVILTPEEWVRQHIVFYLVDQKGYPASLIGIEKTVIINQLKKRFDVVCFNHRAEPILIIECKAPEIKLTGTTLEQVNRYNQIIGATVLMISNGMETFVFKKDSLTNTITYLDEIPNYQDFL